MTTWVRHHAETALIVKSWLKGVFFNVLCYSSLLFSLWCVLCYIRLSCFMQIHKHADLFEPAPLGEEQMLCLTFIQDVKMWGFTCYFIVGFVVYLAHYSNFLVQSLDNKNFQTWFQRLPDKLRSNYVFNRNVSKTVLISYISLELIVLLFICCLVTYF